MKRTRPLPLLLPLVLGAALVAPDAGAAQDPVPDRDRENCICFGDEIGDNLRSSFMLRSDRARLGVYLGDAEDVDGVTGVVILEVVGDGPAEAAGLQDGDVITAIDGTPLGEDPGDALVEALGDREPGDTVELTYYREGNRHTANVVTDQGGGFGVVSPGRFRFADIRTPRSEFTVVSPGGIIRRLASGGLDLAELNSGLGEYFGTDDGVLVLDIDDDSSLGLRPGDVIRAIDGRSVRDAAHVRAILDSYRGDEEIVFEIVRREREMEVTGTLDG